MPKRHLRNRNVKRKTVRFPGGRSSLHYSRKRYHRGNCASCGLPLRGVTSGAGKRVPKSSKRPSRPFAGVLCHSCLREMVRQGTRAA